MDGNANNDDPESPSDSTLISKSTVYDKAAMGPRSKTSIGSDSRAHNEHPSDEQSRALPAESMVADSSLEDISMHGPKALTVAGVRKTLIQIMEDADLHDTGFHCMGEKGIGDAIMRTAHSHLKDQASLVAYVKYLEMSVASLRNSLQCDTASSTPSSPVAEPSVASIDDKRPDLLDNDAGRWIVEVKRWKELYNESEEPATKWSDDGLIHNDESEKERTTQSGHVLISYSLNNKNKVHIDTRLEINSTPLIQTLQRVIQVCSKVPLETLGQEQFILREPYMMIFHHYNQLCEEYSRLQGESKEHLGLLLDFVRDEWPKASETISRTIENDITEIGFGELWLLYSPGTIIYTKEDDEVRAYRVNGLNGFCRSQKMKGQFTGFEIECSWVRFNTSGNKLVETYKILHVSPYTGMQAIRDLEFVPAGYLPGESSQRELLIARGQRYWDYRDKGHFQSYFGTAWLTANPKDGHRVMVDYCTSSRTQDRERRLDSFTRVQPRSIASFRKESGRNSEYSDKDPTSEDESDSFAFSDTETMLCCPTEVRAFSLRDKSWKSVKVSQLGPVIFREGAFKRLVIKGKHKTVVKAMVRAYLSKESTSGDLIQGKGHGLIVLLHGSPGTGKTLTAECVAEKENRPLYMVTCGDLGTEPDDLEKRLKDVFEYAVNWNAVLLLDEADVFLQERDVHDIKRNALVSVFLRELEYFDGVLFLTTNRPGSLDEAFQSRIHIAIGLPDLDAKSQLQVWAIFVKDLNIEKSEKERILQFVDEDIKTNGNLNGRQIRNSVRTALAIAAQMNETISSKHVRDVLEIGRDFTKYLQDVNRMNQEQRAAALGHRAPVVD